MNTTIAYITAGAIAVICLCIIVRYCTTPPRTAFTTACQGIVLIVLILALSTLTSLMGDDETSRSQDDDGGDTHESFSNFPWGHDPEPQYHAWNNDEHASKIVGPDPAQSVLKTWQYNPQNTQVDYRFFRVPACGAADARDQNQLAPVARPTLGIQSPPAREYPTTEFTYGGPPCQPQQQQQQQQQ